MENTVKELKDIIYQLEKKSEYLDERIGFIDRIEDLESKIENLEEEKKELESKNKELEEANDYLNAWLSRTERICERYETRLRDLGDVEAFDDYCEE